jgi:glutamine amidotransferase
VAVFDYGAGNLHSIGKALEAAGAEVAVTADPRAASRAAAVVLPGVGAFGAAAARLAPGRETLRAALAAGTPCLGVCLGMQLLFAFSEEGPGEGLGLIPGRVRRLAARRVPHIGWNAVEDACDPALAAARLTHAYYANGYACAPDDPGCVTAWSSHEGDRFPAAVRAARVLGVQFHPEKSSRAGLALLRAWLDEARAGATGCAAAREVP